MTFGGKVAVITGGGAGFGEAVATQLVERGARVVLVDRDADAVQQVAKQLGDDAHPVVADVSREDDVTRYMQETISRFGRLDLFFNNAGIEGKMLPMTELAVEDFDRVMAVNARGVFLGLREALRIMKPQGSGAVVNTSSQAGIKGGARFSPYVASKHAVIGLSRSAAQEGAPHGVRVNAVAPGHIDTRMARDLTGQINPDDPQSVYERIAAGVPLGRYGTADEVASMVVWLLSDEASYVSGSTFMVDGALNA